jgi:hypothetical protein
LLWTSCLQLMGPPKWRLQNTFPLRKFCAKYWTLYRQTNKYFILSNFALHIFDLKS